MDWNDDTNILYRRKTRLLPPLLYDLAEHITAPRQAWHENPVRKLAYDLSALHTEDVRTVNGYTVYKVRAGGRVRFRIIGSDGKAISRRTAMEAAKVMYGEEA